MGTAGHAGAFHGKDVEVCPDVTVCHHPFEIAYEDLPGMSPAEVIPEPPAGSTIPVLSFEDITLWSSEQCDLLQSSTPVSNGTYSLKVESAPGRLACTCRPFSTELLNAPQGKVRVDLWIGASQPNEYWIGQLQIYFGAPSANLYDVWVGQVELTGLARQTFNTLEILLPSDVVAAINGTFTDASLKIVLNVNAGSGPYYLDNVRFL